MIHTTKGIVLNHIKYKESSIIVNIYTQVFGRQSYMVNKVRSRRSKGNTILLQPLTLLDMEVYHRPKSDIQRIKDFKVAHPLSSIPFKQEKRAMAFFLTELMSKVLIEEEENRDLFDFIYHSVEVFDTGIDGDYNFHLFFLFHLTRFLGFGPEANNSDAPFFDLLNGYFANAEPSHGFSISGMHLDNWKKLHDLNIQSLESINLSGQERYQLLENLLEYYNLHIDSLGELKSLPIVHQLFHDE
ncbi:DNA repair protein RecO [Carboxylicivirga sp. RSCT41]|uniref:DNA repair protein RecO n=1 Tax=Carboxylicivirga agarovorans TaxID=3417570 RepID=UPI003D343C75